MKVRLNRPGDKYPVIPAHRRRKRLTASENLELFDKLRRAESEEEGDEIRRLHDEIVVGNLGLVWRIAFDHPDWGLPIDDLASEGTIGLMRAVKKFDMSRGIKFSTYASRWIRSYMGRAARQQCGLIHVPESARFKNNKYLKMSRHSKRIIAAARFARFVKSLDDLELDGGRSLGANLPDNRSVLSLSGDELAVLRFRIDGLSSRQKDAVRLRFGLGGGEPWTFDQIGQLWGLSQQRVHQILSLAIHRLRQDYGLEAPTERHENTGLQGSPGSFVTRAKLTEEQVVEIMRRITSGESYATLASEYGVTTDAISQINRGKTWKHIHWEDYGLSLRQPNRGLTKEQIIEIKWRLASGESTKSIGEAFDIPAHRVRQIRSGKAYSDIEAFPPASGSPPAG